MDKTLRGYAPGGPAPAINGCREAHPRFWQVLPTKTHSRQVTGTDAAGNVESISEERNTRSWKQRYADGVAALIGNGKRSLAATFCRYTRLADSPPPLTNQKPLTFKVYSFAGQQDQPPTIKDVDPSEYSLAFKKAVPAGVDSTRAVFGGRKLTAQRVSKEGDTVVVTQDVVEDGDWEFSAQLKQEQGRLQSDGGCVAKVHMPVGDA
eukprot:1157749-Pelagomonas_calceolata.AAC.1